ncbi:MAG: hypothetical protein ACT4O6_12605 [Reyranella sp.]
MADDSRPGSAHRRDMARRSTNSHQLKIKALPFVARLRREPPFSSADERELKSAANDIAGPNGWYSMAAFRPDAGGRVYRFATPGQANDMQRWINESGIEDRPPPMAWDGPQLTVAGGRSGHADTTEE